MHIREYIKKFNECQRIGKHRAMKVPMCIMTSPVRPFQNSAIDIVGLMPTSNYKNMYILTVIDLFSKFLEAYLLRKIT